MAASEGVTSGAASEVGEKGEACLVEDQFCLL